MSKMVTRCKKCVLPATYPDIRFNEQGVCSYCLLPTEEKNPSEKDMKTKLDKIIQSYKGKGKV